jgi:hypothetical protein
MAAVDESVDAALSDKTKKNRKHYAKPCANKNKENILVMSTEMSIYEDS